MLQVSRNALVWALAGAVCASAGAAGAQTAPAGDNLIGEVVVTTQRRSERHEGRAGRHGGWSGSSHAEKGPGRIGCYLNIRTNGVVRLPG